ncbi:hypothetical protein FYK23_18140 [Escherichia albertii]|nr:hypothetical protein FYK23_18140 [Escherichia albertii]
MSGNIGANPLYYLSLMNMQKKMDNANPAVGFNIVAVNHLFGKTTEYCGGVVELLT